MSNRSILAILCVGALTSSLAAAQNTTDAKVQSDETASKVDVRTVVKVFLAKDTPGYSIAYEYNFPQRRSVYIKGFGTVPAKGGFRYLTADTQLEFRESPEGKVLARVPLEQTVVVAAKPPLLPIPQVADFPEDSQMFDWESSQSLQKRADLVLNKYFHFAPNSDCEKGMTYVRTTYTPLELKNVPAGVTAQVALLFSLPCNTDAGKYTFQVKSRVMEGRTHSDDFRPTKDPDIVRAADNFVQNVIAEMMAQESGKQ
jgi:hypothetical protein